MSLFPKFKIPDHTPAIPAKLANFGVKSSRISGISSPRATQISNSEVTNDGEADPILSPDQWFREFHRFYVKVVQETRNLDWQWLKEHRPDLWQTIKDKENEIDGLGDAKLSWVMEIMGQWRQLVLKAQFEGSKFDGRQT